MLAATGKLLVSVAARAAAGGDRNRRDRQEGRRASTIPLTLRK
jgi:hypothetical protein